MNVSVKMFWVWWTCPLDRIEYFNMGWVLEKQVK
jgi:hypothetical protein